MKIRFIALIASTVVSLGQQARADDFRFQLAETLATASYANKCPNIQTADVLEAVIGDAGSSFPDIFKSAGYAQAWAFADAQYQHDPGAWCDKVWHMLGSFPPYPLGIKHALLEKRPDRGGRRPILINEYLEFELETKVSQGYVRGVRHGRWDTYSG